MVIFLLSRRLVQLQRQCQITMQTPHPRHIARTLALFVLVSGYVC